jgi:hypothetical protein
METALLARNVAMILPRRACWTAHFSLQSFVQRKSASSGHAGVEAWQAPTIQKWESCSRRQRLTRIQERESAHVMAPQEIFWALCTRWRLDLDHRGDVQPHKELKPRMSTCAVATTSASCAHSGTRRVKNAPRLALRLSRTWTQTAESSRAVKIFLIKLTLKKRGLDLA